MDRPGGQAGRPVLPACFLLERDFTGWAGAGGMSRFSRPFSFSAVMLTAATPIFAADGRRKRAGNRPSPLDRTDLASAASGPGCAALVGGQGIAAGVSATRERHDVDHRAARERQVGWRTAVVGQWAQQRVSTVQGAGSGELTRRIAGDVLAYGQRGTVTVISDSLSGAGQNAVLHDDPAPPADGIASASKSGGAVSPVFEDRAADDDGCTNQGQNTTAAICRIARVAADGAVLDGQRATIVENAATRVLSRHGPVPGYGAVNDLQIA